MESIKKYLVISLFVIVLLMAVVVVLRLTNGDKTDELINSMDAQGSQNSENQAN